MVTSEEKQSLDTFEEYHNIRKNIMLDMVFRMIEPMIHFT